MTTNDPFADEPRPLTPRQQRFVEAYLIVPNATEAAVKAGYSPKAAKANGSRILNSPQVAAAIAAADARRSARTGITADRVLQELAAIAFADPRELVQLMKLPCPDCWVASTTPERRQDASLPVDPQCPTCHGGGVERVVFKDTRTLSPTAARLYAGAKIEKGSIQVLMKDQMAALMAIGKHLRLFTDRVEIEADESLATALQRAIVRARAHTQPNAP